MPELLEPVAGPQLSMHNPETCPFCNDLPPSASVDNQLNNSAAALRSSCHEGDVFNTPEPHAHASGPKWSVKYSDPRTGESHVTDIRSNPHHCIPGKASLKGEYQAPILDFIEASRSVINGNLGYNVNGKHNGIWLPTIPDHFYGGRKSTEPLAGIRWGDLTDRYPEAQFSLAEAAMQVAKRQFHDAHEQYSLEVRQRLEMLRDKVIVRRQRCPIAAGKRSPEVPPPFGLLSWLEALSHRMASFVSIDPLRWREPMWTSRHAKEFHEKITRQKRQTSG